MSRPTAPLWDRPQPRASSPSSAWLQSEPQPWRGMGSGHPADITSTFSSAIFSFPLPNSAYPAFSAASSSASIHPPPALPPPPAPWSNVQTVTSTSRHPTPPAPPPLRPTLPPTGVIHPLPPSVIASHQRTTKKRKRERARGPPPCLSALLPSHTRPPVDPLLTRKPLEFPTLTSPVRRVPPQSTSVPPTAPAYSHGPLHTTHVTGASASHAPVPPLFLPSVPPHPTLPANAPPTVTLDTAATFDYGILNSMPAWVTGMGNMLEDEGVQKEVNKHVNSIVDLCTPFPPNQLLPLAVDSSLFRTPFDDLCLVAPAASSSWPRLSPVGAYLIPPGQVQQVTAVPSVDHTPSPPLVTTPRVEGYVPEDQRPQPPRVVLPGQDLGIAGSQTATEFPGMAAQKEGTATGGCKSSPKGEQSLFPRSQFGQPSKPLLASRSVFAQAKRPAEEGKDRAVDRAEAYGPSGIDGVMELRGDADAVVKRFRCEVCGDLFGRRNDCVRHQRSTHSSEKPFTCQGCSNAFARKDKLRHHQQSSKACRAFAQPKRQRRQ